MSAMGSTPGGPGIVRDPESSFEQPPPPRRMGAAMLEAIVKHRPLLNPQNREKAITEKREKAITRDQMFHFVDLLYVAAIFNINHLINACGDGTSRVQVFAACIFTILFNSRYLFDVYCIMFYAVDLVHRSLFLAFNLGVFIMTLNIKFTPNVAGHRALSEAADDEGSYGSDSSDNFTIGHCTINDTYIYGFAAGYLLTRLVLLLLYSTLIYFARVNQERNAMLTYCSKAVPLVLGCVVMLSVTAAGVNPESVFLVVALTEFLADYLPEALLHYLEKYDMNLFNFTISLRPSVLELQTRLQEFFLIVLGESMIGLLVEDSSVHEVQAVYVTSLFSFTLFFSLGIHFLTCVYRPAVEVHAMKKGNALIRMTYIWFHPVVCFALLISINSIIQLRGKLVGADGASQYSYGTLKLTISVGLALTILGMIIMRIMHKGVAEHLRHRGMYLHLLFRLLVAGLHVLVYFVEQENLYFIMTHSLLCTSSNVVEMLIPHFTGSEVSLFLTRHTVDAHLLHGSEKALNPNSKSHQSLSLQQKHPKSKTQSLQQRDPKREAHAPVIAQLQMVEMGERGYMGGMGRQVSAEGAGEGGEGGEGGDVANALHATASSTTKG